MIATVVCSVLLYAMLLLIPLCDFESPVQDELLVKAFGERPFGMHWRAFWSVLITVLYAPIPPLGLYNLGVLLFYSFHMRGDLRAMGIPEELANHYDDYIDDLGRDGRIWRHALGAAVGFGHFIALLLAWIVYAAWLGI
jgi:hypothetical protein